MKFLMVKGQEEKNQDCAKREMAGCALAQGTKQSPVSTALNGRRVSWCQSCWKHHRASIGIFNME